MKRFTFDELCSETDEVKVKEKIQELLHDSEKLVFFEKTGICGKILDTLSADGNWMLVIRDEFNKAALMHRNDFELSDIKVYVK